MHCASIASRCPRRILDSEAAAFIELAYTERRYLEGVGDPSLVSLDASTA
jgi:hypothetical protein